MNHLPRGAQCLVVGCNTPCPGSYFVVEPFYLPPRQTGQRARRMGDLIMPSAQPRTAMRIRSRSRFPLHALVVAMAACLSAAIGAADAEIIERRPVAREVANAILLEGQASDLAAKGRVAEAEPLYRQSLAAIEQSLPNDPILAGSLNNVANFYIAQRRFGEATELLERALTIYVSAYGDNHTLTAKVINNLANAYLSDRKYDKAEALYQRGLVATETLLGPGHYAVAISLDWLAQTNFYQQRYAEAEEELRRGITVAEKSTGPDSQLVVRLLDHLMSVVAAQGRVQEAAAIKEHAQAIIAKASKP